MAMTREPPVREDESGAEDHAEHAEIDRIANDGVRALRDQVMIFEDACLVGPLLAEGLHGAQREERAA